MIHINHVNFSIGRKGILSEIDLELNPGQLYGISGPNGSGKSTLLKVMAGLLKPDSGMVEFDRIWMEDWQEAELSQFRAFLQQSTYLSMPFRVIDLINMGRYPYRRSCSPEENAARVREAMVFMDLLPFAGRSCLELSGGELQRVQIARVLAQLLGKSGVEGKVLLADEPLNNLDIRHQHETLKILKTLADAGALVVTVLHDLNMCLQYCDRTVLLHQGRLLAEGAPADCLSPNNIQTAFGVQSRMVHLKDGATVHSIGDSANRTLIYE